MADFHLEGGPRGVSTMVSCRPSRQAHVRGLRRCPCPCRGRMSVALLGPPGAGGPPWGRARTEGRPPPTHMVGMGRPRAGSQLCFAPRGGTACPGPSCDAGLDAQARSFLELPGRILTQGQGSELQTSSCPGGTVPLLTAVRTVGVAVDSALMGRRGAAGAGTRMCSHRSSANVQEGGKNITGTRLV